MKIILDEFEQSIEGNTEKYIPLSDVEMNDVESIINAANETKNINIRISAYDIERVKQRSAEEGIPYQTLISSVIHSNNFTVNLHQNQPFWLLADTRGSEQPLKIACFAALRVRNCIASAKLTDFCKSLYIKNIYEYYYSSDLFDKVVCWIHKIFVFLVS